MLMQRSIDKNGGNMAKLTIEIEIQTYGDDDDIEMLAQIRDTVVAVVNLCDLSVGTFVRSHIGTEDE